MTGQVQVRLFAAARAAAGTGSRPVAAGLTLAEVNDLLAREHSPDLARVLQGCSFLVDGRRTDRTSTTPLAPGTTVEVLPPFAGG